MSSSPWQRLFTRGSSTGPGNPYSPSAQYTRLPPALHDPAYPAYLREENRRLAKGRSPVARYAVIGAAVLVGVVVVWSIDGSHEGQSVPLGTTDAFGDNDRGVTFSLFIDTDDNRVWARSDDDRFRSAILVDARTGMPLTSASMTALSRMDNAMVMAYDYPSCSPDTVVLNYNHATGRWDLDEVRPTSEAPFMVNRTGNLRIVENCELQFGLSLQATN